MDKKRRGMALRQRQRRGGGAVSARELICKFARTLPLITTCKSLLRTIIGWEWHWPWTHHLQWYTLHSCCSVAFLVHPRAVVAAVNATSAYLRQETETRTSLFGHYLFWSSFFATTICPRCAVVVIWEGERGRKAASWWRCWERLTDRPTWMQSLGSDQWTELRSCEFRFFTSPSVFFGILRRRRRWARLDNYYFIIILLLRQCSQPLAINILTQFYYPTERNANYQIWSEQTKILLQLGTEFIERQSENTGNGWPECVGWLARQTDRESSRNGLYLC